MRTWNIDDSTDLLELETEANQPASGATEPTASHSGAATVRLHSFDLQEEPQLVGLPSIPHELVRARTTVPLTSKHIGSEVIVVFEAGDVRRPIVLGVLSDPSLAPSTPPAPGITPNIDEGRLVVWAEREVTFKCGDASITLTRAGKVIIRGKYIVSRSSGKNRIKGAVVDIN